MCIQVWISTVPGRRWKVPAPPSGHVPRKAPLENSHLLKIAILLVLRPPKSQSPLQLSRGFGVPPGQLTVYGPAAVTSGVTGLVKYFRPVLHMQTI